MKRPSRASSWQFRAAVFGALPLVLGLGGYFLACWRDAVWLTDAGRFWPYVLSLTSAAILVRLTWSAFEEATSAVAAWLVLLATWLYVPMWAAAIEVPHTAAVVTKDGRTHLAREAARYPDGSVRLLTHSAGTRIVHNVAGTLSLSELEIEYSYAPSYIATRRDGEDLRSPIAQAAEPILRAIAHGSRTSRIALIESPSVQREVLADICRAAVGHSGACPIKMKLTPSKGTTEGGAIWSKQYSEAEAIAERHLPSLVRLLTQSDAPLENREDVFRSLLELATTAAQLAPVVRRSQRLDDHQFDTLVRHVLRLPGCADVAVELVQVNRLTGEQRQALRAKAFSEAALATLVDHAAALRLTDAEVADLADRMRPGARLEPSIAVRALSVLGDRLPGAAQSDLVEAITRGGAAHSLVALQRLNFSPALRTRLMSKVLADASPEDFASARLTKEALLDSLTPAELRQVIATAVKRSESSAKWLAFSLESLPIRDMQPEERRSLLDGLLFKSPKDALEFVSKYRDYLAPTEVAEVTRDYTRTITREFCEHLSHRNRNWKTNYFSPAQLQIFEECARSR